MKYLLCTRNAETTEGINATWFYYYIRPFAQSLSGNAYRKDKETNTTAPKPVTFPSTTLNLPRCVSENAPSFVPIMMMNKDGERTPP